MTTSATSFQLSPSVQKVVSAALLALGAETETLIDECDAVHVLATRLLCNTGMTTQQLRDAAAYCFHPENEEAGVVYSEMLSEKIRAIPLTHTPEQVLHDIFTNIDKDTDGFDEQLACQYSMVGTMTAVLGLSAEQFTAAINA